MRTRLGYPLPILAGLVLAVAALGSFPVLVAAHARLADSKPPNGSAVAEMPALGESVVDGETVLAPLGGAELDPQTVTIAWRAVSAADGHETAGLLIFSVGTGVPPRIDATSLTDNSDEAHTIEGEAPMFARGDEQPHSNVGSRRPSQPGRPWGQASRHLRR